MPKTARNTDDKTHKKKSGIDYSSAAECILFWLVIPYKLAPVFPEMYGRFDEADEIKASACGWSANHLSVKNDGAVLGEGYENPSHGDHRQISLFVEGCYTFVMAKMQFLYSTTGYGWIILEKSFCTSLLYFCLWLAASHYMTIM